MDWGIKAKSTIEILWKIKEFPNCFKNDLRRSFSHNLGQKWAPRVTRAPPWTHLGRLFWAKVLQKWLSWMPLGCFGDGWVGSVGSAGRRWAERRKKLPGTPFLGSKMLPVWSHFWPKLKAQTMPTKSAKKLYKMNWYSEEEMAWIRRATKHKTSK